MNVPTNKTITRAAALLPKRSEPPVNETELVGPAGPPAVPVETVPFPTAPAVVATLIGAEGKIADGAAVKLGLRTVKMVAVGMVQVGLMNVVEQMVSTTSVA